MEISSPARERQFHILEGGFYKGTDAGRALQHYRALASMPGAPWSDSLPLARMYGNLGRHREASEVFRRILPDLIRGLDTPLGKIVRNSGLLRRAAMSFAVEGDLTAARNLLRLEGRTRENQIPEEIERLRQTAPRIHIGHRDSTNSQCPDGASIGFRGLDDSVMNSDIWDTGRSDPHSRYNGYDEVQIRLHRRF